MSKRNGIAVQGKQMSSTAYPAASDFRIEDQNVNTKLDAHLTKKSLSFINIPFRFDFEHKILVALNYKRVARRAEWDTIIINHKFSLETNGRKLLVATFLQSSTWEFRDEPV